MPETTQPLIKPLYHNDTYVLSKDFYNNTTNQSLLESLTSAYLKGDSVSTTDLKKLYSDIKNWNKLERYYYVPILTFLSLINLKEPRSTWLNPLG